MKRLLTLFFLLNAALLVAQPGTGTQMRGGFISGRVFDLNSDHAIEYANIILFNSIDSSQVTGTISDSEGFFRLTGIRPGDYYLEVHFIGYYPVTIDKISINRQNRQIDTGEIAMKPAVLNADAVVVEGERAAVTYKIDKQVIDVSQQQVATSGTAVEVLENVPSVTVDIEGNVSLRGSSDFSVLIDGRPSILDPSESLQQIPASSIDNIEIITNPSAKYIPDGTSGIINVILKKDQKSGHSGIVNINSGWNDKYGAELTYSRRTEKVYSTFNIDFNRRNYLGSRESENITTQQNTTTYVFSEGDSKRGRVSLGLRGAVDFNLTKNDIINIGARYGERDGGRTSETDYREWVNDISTLQYYTSEVDRERGGPYYSFYTDYHHRFNGEGHELKARLNYRFRTSNEKTTNELISNGEMISGRRTTEKGPGERYRTELEYVLPFNESSKFEAGYQNRMNFSEDETELFDYDTLTAAYVKKDQYSNKTKYDRNIHALYTLYGAEWGKVGYQFGMRGEYTYRTVKSVKNGQKFSVDRWDYFPTIHLSYQFPDGQQFMTSYTRRINRPRGWYLEPFETWIDAYNIRVGNPALKPEYIDSYETGFQSYFGQSLFSLEGYFRQTNNKIERVRTVYAPNVTLGSIENVGKDYALGGEVLLNFDPVKRWNMILTGNIYQYRVEGELYDQSFSRESFNWNARLNNMIRLFPNTRLQITGMYNSPTVSSQGERDEFYMANLAVRQSFLDKKLYLTLQIRDIFGTAHYESITEGQGFYKYYYGTRESPLVYLNMRYIFGQQRQERRNRENGNGEMPGFEDDF